LDERHATSSKEEKYENMSELQIKESLYHEKSKSLKILNTLLGEIPENKYPFSFTIISITLNLKYF
jgi:hypothetical protein